MIDLTIEILERKLEKHHKEIAAIEQAIDAQLARRATLVNEAASFARCLAILKEHNAGE